MVVDELTNSLAVVFKYASMTRQHPIDRERINFPDFIAVLFGILIHLPKKT
jgi:hypothetical protein